MADTVETAVYRLRVEGQAEIDRLTRSVDGLSVAEEKAASSTRTFSQALQNNVARIDPLVRAQEQYKKALETNLRYRESGVGTEAQLNAQLEASTKRYQQQVAVINQVEKATVAHTNAQKLQGYQMLNLSRQIQDVGVSLFSGQSPIMVLAQQLPQIVDISQASGVSLTNMFRQAASGALSFISPLTAIGGAMAAFDGAVIAAAAHWTSAQKDIERALAGIGRASGATVNDINAIGFATARVSDLSIGEARELATSLAATGKISKDMLGPATQTAQQLAKALGTDAADAAKMLGTALADPTKGVEALDAATGAFNVTTREQIAQAMRMGDVGQAQAIMLQRLQAATLNAAKANESWTDSFKDAWKWIKDTTSAAGEMTARGAATLRYDLGGARPTTGVSTADQLAQARGDLAAEQQSLANRPQASSGMEFARSLDNIRNLTAEIERLKQLRFEEDLAAWNVQLDRAANAATKATNAMIPQIDHIKQLEGLISDLTRAMNVPDIGGPLKDSYQQALTAAQNLLRVEQDAKQAAAEHNEYVKQLGESYKDVSINVALQLDAMKDQLRIVQATTAAGKESAQRAKDENDARRSGATAAEATEIAIGKAALRTAQSAESAEQLHRRLLGAASAAQQAADASQQINEALENAARAAQDAAAALGGIVAGDVFTPKNLNRFGDLGSGMGSSMPMVMGVSGPLAYSGIDTGFADILNQQYAKAMDPATLKANADARLKASTSTDKLTDSVDKLKSSTDSLNQTNQDLLSPFYTQDPRTSHIGFRSQGMASGGFIDVPGSPSANDNMTAIIPVASGERIYVDPMPSKRGGSGGNTMINITAPMMFAGNVNKDEVGRTVYQSLQVAARSMQAAQR